MPLSGSKAIAGISAAGGCGDRSGQVFFSVGGGGGSGRKSYVADYNNQRIQVFSANGQFQRDWGENGTGNGEFAYPQGVAVDPNSREVYVADTNNHRIFIEASGGGQTRVKSTELEVTK
jgi:DNA-binding beta-propeller fold protein YncE